MRPISHAVAGAGLGGAMYLATGDWRLAGVCAATEVLLDIDHAVEHLMRSKRPFSLGTFLKHGNAATWPRMVFVLHAHEWTVALAVGASVSSSPLLWSVTLGVFAHLLLDEVGNRLPWTHTRIYGPFYFFTYRLAHGFRTGAISEPRVPPSGEQSEIQASLEAMDGK